MDGDHTGRDCTSGPREPKGARPPTSPCMTTTTVNDLLLFNLKHPVLLLLRRGAMNFNCNIMPVPFIGPPIVHFIPADPIFTDLYERQMVYNVFYLGRHITTTVTRDPVVVQEWIFNVRRFNFSHIRSHFVGLAVLTPPRSMTSARRPAIIELCIGQNCIIFQLGRARRILSDPNITFVGFQMALIRRRLQRNWGFVVRNAEDIQILAARSTGTRLREPSQILIERLLGLTSVVRWPYEVGNSAWHQQELSLEQVTYACAKANLPYELGVRILNTDV